MDARGPAIVLFGLLSLYALYMAASTAGTPPGFAPIPAPEPPWTAIDESLHVQDLVNGYRAQYGRGPLRWDERLYDLAVYLARDMYERGYLDLVTPEGRCAKTLALQFGIAYRSIAESIQGCEGYCAFRASPADAVSAWMSSGYHRYNLLYPGHSAGAVGCYQSTCVFLGTGNELHGLGSGGCTPGEEVSKSWAAIPRSPTGDAPRTAK